MTPVMRILRVVFFQGVASAEDRERRLQEAERRRDHASRVVVNAVAEFNQARETDRQMVEMMRDLSAQLEGEPR